MKQIDLDWFYEREEELKKKEESLLVELRGVQDERGTVELIKNYLKKHLSPIEDFMFEKYIKHIEAYSNWAKVDVDGELRDPDETFMRKIEQNAGISENGKKAFREEILIRYAAAERKNKVFNYESHPTLRDGIIKSL